MGQVIDLQDWRRHHPADAAKATDLSPLRRRWDVILRRCAETIEAKLASRGNHRNTSVGQYCA
jgi:hypothetical protein